MSDSLEAEDKRARDFTQALTERFAYVEARPLSVQRIEGALLTGRRYWPDRTFTGAVYDGAGTLVGDATRVNDGDISPADPPLLAEFAARRSRARRVRRAVYGGILFPILGHLLVETLGQLWPRVAPEGGAIAGRPVLFHPWLGTTRWSIFANPLYRAILGAVGVGPVRTLIPPDDLAVDELLVPARASIYHDFMHPIMGPLFERIGAAIADPPGRSGPPVFLSRSRWSQNRRIADPDTLDRIFDALGFAVIHPERTRPARLLASLRAAPTVASTDGSQAHLAAFCRPGTRTILLDTRLVPTQTALERLRGLEAVHVPLFDSAMWAGDGGPVTDPDLLGQLVRRFM